MAFEGLIVVPNAFFQIQQQSLRFVSFSLVRLGMQLVLNLVLLIGFDMGVAGVLLSGLISNVLIGGYLMLRLLTVVRPRFHGPDARAFLRFGLPLVAMQIATTLVKQAAMIAWRSGVSRNRTRPVFDIM